MSRKRGRPRKILGDLPPTPERLAQGQIERSSRTLADEAGNPARPYRAVDTLTAMLRHCTITPAMHQAAEDFRVLFVTAQLNALRAADLTRVPDGTHELPLTLRQAEARKKVWQALNALGGMAAPAGSCVWHVVGCEWTVKEWALRLGWNGHVLRPEMATGILVSSLGVLQAYFGL